MKEMADPDEYFLQDPDVLLADRREKEINNEAETRKTDTGASLLLTAHMAAHFMSWEEFCIRPSSDWLLKIAK
jgi:hypothetical protein